MLLSFTASFAEEYLRTKLWKKHITVVNFMTDMDQKQKWMWESVLVCFSFLVVSFIPNEIN